MVAVAHMLIYVILPTFWDLLRQLSGENTCTYMLLSHLSDYGQGVPFMYAMCGFRVWVVVYVSAPPSPWCTHHADCQKQEGHYYRGVAGMCVCIVCVSLLLLRAFATALVEKWGHRVSCTLFQGIVCLCVPILP